MIKLLFSVIAGNGDDHRALFLRNELRTMLGSRNKNLKTLAYFTLLAFIAVVFAEAGLRYLDMRMNNPYVQWITFPVTADMNKDYERIVDSLDVTAADHRFTLDGYGGFNRYSLSFRDREGKRSDRLKGRTFILTNDEELLNTILADARIKNVESSDPHTWSEAMQKTGIILTEEIWSRIGEQQDTLYVQYNENYFFTAHVIAVVKSLPDRALFMTSYEMFWGLARSQSSVKEHWIHDPAEKSTLEFLIRPGSETIQSQATIIELNKKLQEQGKDVKVNQVRVELLEKQEGPFTHRLNLVLDTAHGSRYQEAVVDLAMGARELTFARPFLEEEFIWHRTGDLVDSEIATVRPGSNVNKYSSMNVHFQEIDSIRPFRNYMLNRFELDISLEQIESRENFYLVSVITLILAVALILFTLISISLFITNILRAHLEKIRMNLGTFMAFGLSREFLVKSYGRIILGILGFVFLFSLLVVGVLDVLRIPYRLLTALGMSLRPDFNEAFSVFGYGLTALILLILVLTWWSGRRAVNAVLRHYPSDLIYNRTE